MFHLLPLLFLATPLITSASPLVPRIVPTLSCSAVDLSATPYLFAKSDSSNSLLGVDTTGNLTRGTSDLLGQGVFGFEKCVGKFITECVPHRLVL